MHLWAPCIRMHATHQSIQNCVIYNKSTNNVLGVYCNKNISKILRQLKQIEKEILCANKINLKIHRIA